MPYPKTLTLSDKPYRNAFSEETEFARIRREMSALRTARQAEKVIMLRLVDVSRSAPDAMLRAA